MPKPSNTRTSNIDVSHWTRCPHGCLHTEHPLVHLITEHAPGPGSPAGIAEWRNAPLVERSTP